MHIARFRAAALAVLTVGGVAAALSPTADAAPVRYTVDQRVCPPATHVGEFTCFAVRQVPVSASTPGAKIAPAAALPDWATGPAGGLTPRALATAYHYDPNMGGSKQTVAIVDWYDDPNVLADLNRFNHHYGRPAETASSFRKVNEDGKAAPLPRPDKNTTVEITLDVQTVRAVCPRCKILLVEADAPQSDNLARAENTAARMGATVISNSFGTPEHRGHPFPDWLRLAFDHHGVVITASTGDDGWYSWDVTNEGIAVPGTPNFPASSPKVISVGGTKLNLAANGQRSSEPVWNDNGRDDSVGARRGAMGATGSGCSVLFAAPAWQKAEPNYAHSGCNGMRFTADVAADAAPATGLDIYDSYGAPGWITVGGTSLSAPLVGALYALVGGANGVDFPAQTLYRNIDAHPRYAYDVVSGGSSWCGGDNIDGCSQAVWRDSIFLTKNPNVWEGQRVDCSYPLHVERTSDAPRNLSCNAAPGLDGPTGVGAPSYMGLFRPSP
jgi:subtilase family serine protease